jgi:hypothetical protein
VIVAVLGYEPTPALRLIDYARSRAPVAGDALAEWASLYAELAPVAGVRTAIAWAQALKETDYFRFTGRAQPDWNNPCGLGVGSQPLIRDGVAVPNSADCRFATRELGVRAHLGHLIVYVGAPYDVSGFCDADPRHVAHRRFQNSARELGGPGRWAPAADYGETIIAAAALILVPAT